MNRLPVRTALLTAFLIIAAPSGGALAGEALLRADCMQCHDLTGPGPATLDELQARKGPDLYYAGNKYKRDWLQEWLQRPARIRPAGMFFANHVKSDDGRDSIRTDTLIEHPALTAEAAGKVADYLMTLKAKAHLIKEGEYQPGSIALNMGEMLFDRFRGCLACHEIEQGYGGLSGPEVYTAAARLQEDYMISYMRNPQAWEVKSIMPNRQLTDNDLQRLVHYLRALNAETTP